LLVYIVGSCPEEAQDPQTCPQHLWHCQCQFELNTPSLEDGPKANLTEQAIVSLRCRVSQSCMSKAVNRAESLGSLVQAEALEEQLHHNNGHHQGLWHRLALSVQQFRFFNNQHIVLQHVRIRTWYFALCTLLFVSDCPACNAIQGGM
jgi:hypothetical protein